MNPDIKAINEKIIKESEFTEKIIKEVSKVIVGQSYMIERLLIGLLSNGHILLEGVPGLAKTLTVNTISSTIKTKFQRRSNISSVDIFASEVEYFSEKYPSDK